MGACASKPKDLDRDLAPAPVPVEDNVPQEKKDGEETKKEEPLIDVSAEAPKIEEVTTDTKAVVEVEASKDVKKEETAEEVKVEAVKEEPKEQQPAEEDNKPKEAKTVAQ